MTTTLESGGTEQVNEDASIQLPIQIVDGDVREPTLVRELNSQDNKGGIYNLAIAENNAALLLDYLSLQTKQDFCIYAQVSIVV